MKTKENHLKHMQNPFIDFSDLIAHIPVGVCKFLMDDHYTILYGNQYLYDLFGCTKKQLKEELNNAIVPMFLMEERSSIKEKLKSEFSLGSSGFRLEHRIIRRDNSIIWVLVSGNFTIHNGLPSVYAMVVDITDRKQMEEQLRIDEERFRLALAQTDNTIFDYHIATKVMIHADKSAEAYGLPRQTDNVPDFLVEEKIVHPSSAKVYLEMYHQIREGSPTASCIIQAKTIDGKYAWRKIRMTNIFDQDGNAVRAVGMLEDIDEQTRREELLLERSQRDPLTGLYNKGTTESKIHQLLEKENCSGAFFILDLDAFKEVNDCYGHLFGDLVLSESAYRVSNLFRREDVVGRIGGDEFLIYFENNFEDTTALRKAEEICAAFLEEFSHNDTHTTITCTVGLALCPDHGNSFEALYQKADIALYEAKRKGKNCFCLYTDSMGDKVKSHSSRDNGIIL